MREGHVNVDGLEESAGRKNEDETCSACEVAELCSLPKISARASQGVLMGGCHLTRPASIQAQAESGLFSSKKRSEARTLVLPHSTKVVDGIFSFFFVYSRLDLLQSSERTNKAPRSGPQMRLRENPMDSAT